jgi:glucose-1-phosphate thymidylyltransferase
VTGLYFYDNDIADRAASLRPSAPGNSKITDLNMLYFLASPGKLSQASLDW